MSPKILLATCVSAQLVLLAVCYNGMSATLGWGISVDSPWAQSSGIDRSTTAWATVYFVYWFVMQAIVLVLCFEQLSRHIARDPWFRMPSLVGMSNSRSPRFSRRLHRGLILFLVMTSLYAGGRFVKKTLEADVYCGSNRAIEHWTEHFFRAGSRCWLDGQVRGVQYYPPIEAWLLVIAFVSVAFLWVVVLRALTRNS